MNQLVWRGETVSGKYLGEVALLTELSPVVHCETFVDGNWRLWSYVADKEQVLQQGKATDLKEAQYICEQAALAWQGVQGLQDAEALPMQPPMQSMMPMFMTVMPNMQAMYAQPQHTDSQTGYEDVNADASSLLQELRFKFRRWAISLTLIGGVFLCIWYSMLLKPVSTISLLLVLMGIIWGAQAIIKSFKRPRASASPPPTDEGITIFSTSQVRPSRRQLKHQSRYQPQSVPVPHMPAHQLGYVPDYMPNQLTVNATNAMGIMQAAAALPYQNAQSMSMYPIAAQQAVGHVLPQVQAPQAIQPVMRQPVHPQPMQQQGQASFYHPAMHMQQYQRGNG